MPVETVSRPHVKPEVRTANVQTIGQTTILWLTVGKLTLAYRVTALRHQFGKAAFHLEKANQGTGEDPEQYDVLLDGQMSTCDCAGFTYHGMKACGGRGCKHVSGCQAALDAGKLQAASKPASCKLCHNHTAVEGGLCLNCLCPF